MRVLDLFAGCGGLSSGLLSSGYEITGAVEKDKWASDSYRCNHSEVNLIEDDVSNLTSEFIQDLFSDRVDIVAGGPPCQGFSVSGKRQFGEFNQTNNMVLEFIRIVAALKPNFVLFENVAGFSSAALDEHRGALPYLKAELNEMGYQTTTKVLQAADFGVPQYRRRLFLIANRVPLSKSPFPDETHDRHGTLGKHRHLGVLDAIQDLPLIEAREGCDGKQPYTRKSKNEYQALMRSGSAGVFNHEAMKHSKRLVERFQGIPEGGRGYDIGRKHDSKNSVTVYKSNNQRLVSALPSLCITANFQSNYVHPELDRNLTAREGARIQSFPDSFIFKGRRTLMSKKLLAAEGRHDENHLSQYNQIGNAVPPLLVKALARALLEASVSSYKQPMMRSISA